MLNVIAVRGIVNVSLRLTDAHFDACALEEPASELRNPVWIGQRADI
jgi:hypothetical protein